MRLPKELQEREKGRERKRRKRESTKEKKSTRAYKPRHQILSKTRRCHVTAAANSLFNRQPETSRSHA